MRRRPRHGGGRLLCANGQGFLPSAAKCLVMKTLTDYNSLAAFLFALADEVRRHQNLDSLQEALALRGYDAPWRKAHLHPPAEADLHLHSNASDGMPTPAEVVLTAAILGLRAFGLVDHDSVDGVNEAFTAAARLNLGFWPGMELSTGRSGLEVLLYWPCAAEAAAFLAAPAAAPLHDYLRRAKDRTQRRAEAALAAANRFLRDLDPAADRPITLDELGAWYRGRLPYYPGTVAGRTLARLTPAERARTGLHDPRQVYTEVILARLEQDTDRLADVLALIQYLRRAGPPCLAALAHPRELLTKGRMSLAEVRAFFLSLAEQESLDGLEVNNSRDSAEDSTAWMDLLDEANRARSARNRPPLLGFWFSSDSHMLAPGTASAEFTPGYGRLDEGEAFRGGNLRPRSSWREFERMVRARLKV